jgi:hypothetical protein
MRFRRRYLLALAALAIHPSALADEIRVSGGNCASGVHLVARDARFSDVLKRLARTLDFKVSFESESDPLVNFNATRQPIDLVAQLAPLENISMAKAYDPRCPNRERILKVWVLPKGRDKTALRAGAPPQARPIPDATEQARQAGIDQILPSPDLPPEQRNPDDPH